MPLEPELDDVEGAQQLYDWFGYWPSFHDAEILSLHLNRTGPSTLVIHTWEMTDELDERNFYVLIKHVVVEFSLAAVSNLSLTGFNHQNVIGDLGLQKTNHGFRIEIGECYGLGGTLDTDKISVQIFPGKPTDKNP